MKRLFGQVVFALGKDEYAWADVALAAALRGDWPGVLDRARDGRARVASAETDEEDPLTDEEVEAAANEFRYDRDLVTAEETETWLSRWGLDAEAWMDWIYLDLLRRRGGDEPMDVEVAVEDLNATLYAEAVCSNALSRFADRLAAAAAAFARSGGADEDERPGEVDEKASELEALGLEGLGLDLPPEGIQGRIRQLSRLERAYQRLRAEVVTPESVEASVRAHQIEWMRVDTRVLQLPGEDVAREALTSIRDDGCTLEEVARAAGAELRSGVAYLEDFEPALRDRLLGARKGELLGPMKNGDGYTLVLVAEKVLASSDDPEIAARAGEKVFANVLGREVDNRVSWRWGK